MADMTPALPVRNGTETGETELKVLLADATTPAQTLAINASGEAAVTGILHDAATPAQTLAINASGQAAVSGIIHDATTPAQTLVVDANGAAKSTIVSGANVALAINAQGSANTVLFDSAGAERKGTQAVADSLSVTQATSDVWNVNVVSDVPAGTVVNEQLISASLASAAEGFVEYAPGVAFKFNEVSLSASAAMKFEVWKGLAATATPALIRSGGVGLLTRFSTAASPVAPDKQFANDVAILATESVYVIFTNRDNQNQSGYATISGYKP